MGSGLEDLLTKPLPELHHSLLMAGSAEVSPLTGKGQKILMTAVLTLNAGEAVVEDAAIKISIDDLLHISMEEAVLGGEPLVIDLIFLPASSPLREGMPALS